MVDMAQWLEHEFTDRKVRGSNPTPALGLSLSRLGQPGSIPAYMHLSDGIAVSHQKGATSERIIHSPPSPTFRPRIGTAQWSKRELTGPWFDSTSRASVLLLYKLGQPGSISALVLPSGGAAAMRRNAAATSCNPVFTTKDDTGNDIDGIDQIAALLCPATNDLRVAISGAKVDGKETLSDLEHLNLRGNRLETFNPCLTSARLSTPSQCRCCPSELNSVLCSASRRAQLVDDYCDPLVRSTRFPALKTLDLGNNSRLKDLHPSVTDLYNLRQLFLDGCTSLTTLPADLWHLSKLHTLYLHKTPFDHYLRRTPITPGAVDPVKRPASSSDSNTMQSVLDRFQKLSHGLRPNTEARLMVVGPRGAGKTSLVQLLHAVEEHTEDDWCLWKKSANLLTGRSVVRTRPAPLDFPCLGLDNLAVSQPSCFLRVAWQLGTGKALQLNDFFFLFFLSVIHLTASANLLTGRSVVRTRPAPLDFPCLGLDNLAVSQPSCFLRVAWQLGTGKALQLNDFFFLFFLSVIHLTALKRPRMFRSRVSARSSGPQASTGCSGELTDLSFDATADPSPVVHVSRMVVHRPPAADGTTAMASLDVASNWCEDVTFNIWDIGDPNPSPLLAWERTTSGSQSSPVANNVTSETMTLIEQSLYCPVSVFIIVWRVSDGVDGLNQATQWLMDIQAKVRTAPVILVGTHVDGLQPDITGVRGLLRNPRSSTPSLTPEFINSLVRARFSTSNDLASFGLPRLYGHVLLDLRPQSNENLRSQLAELLSVIHKAANTIQLSRWGRDGSCGWSANLLTRTSVVRTRPLHPDIPCLALGKLAVSQPSCILRVGMAAGTRRVLQLNDLFFFSVVGSVPTADSPSVYLVQGVDSIEPEFRAYWSSSVMMYWDVDLGTLAVYAFSLPDSIIGARYFCGLEREFTGREFHGSNPASASRFLSRPDQPGNILVLVLLSGDMIARHREGRAAAAMMLGSRPSLRLLGLNLPELYRQALTCTHQIAAELHHTLQIPVLPRERFIFELHKRLCQQPDPPPIPVTSELHSFPSDSEDPTPPNRARSPVFLSTRSHGFRSVAESHAVLVFLNDFGHLLHFNDPALSSFVFLSPAWLIQLLLRLFTRLHRTRRMNTALIRRSAFSETPTGDQFPVSGHTRSSSELPWLQSPSSNTAVITESDLADLVVQCLDKPYQIAQTDSDISLLLEAIVPLLLKLELALRLDDKRVLLPSLLSTRSVRSQQLISYVSPTSAYGSAAELAAPTRAVRVSWDDLSGRKGNSTSDALRSDSSADIPTRTASLHRISLEREFTDWKVRGSNRASVSRPLLPGLEQPDSIPDLVLPSGGGMVARHRKRVTTGLSVHRKVHGSNPTSAPRFPLSRFGHPDSIAAPVLPSGGMAARHRKDATSERLLLLLFLSFMCASFGCLSHSEPVHSWSNWHQNKQLATDFWGFGLN
ncbi:hypothetical protein T265_07700 [Opisthorchis viverrini]|uniref:Roc domain-containing protein n=1 Tax=Opisthorchis viverrini TaxID=6198 RepID=A0A074ZN00_OPIVI|nr:hypothetical protein T265_07700 [Opisthorchis viverrini]KER24700.1 hypothetical protein T265_07700 [Opisthorchis viverrini]